MIKGLLKIGALLVMLVLILFFLYVIAMPKPAHETIQIEATPRIDNKQDVELQEEAIQEELQEEITQTEQQETQQSLELSIGDSFSDGLFNVTIFSQKKVNSYEYFSEIEQESFMETAGSEKSFVIIEIRVHNQDKNEQEFELSAFELIDSEGNTYNTKNYRGEDSIPSSIQLRKNERIKGEILFKIPSEAQNLKLYFNFPFIFNEEEPLWTI